MQPSPFYSEEIIRHWHNPTHKKTLPGANLTLAGENPNCGDRIVLHLLVNKAGIVEDGSFTGDGCAVSQASANMMLDLIVGKSTEEALRIYEAFVRMCRGSADETDLDLLGEVASIETISRTPARVKCAVLGWRTMKACLDGENQY